MVVTDLPFCRADALQSRYVLLKTPTSAPTAATVKQDSKDCQEYAAFLKEKERRCGPDGFLDSGRFQHSFQLRQSKDKDPSKARAMTAVDLSARKDRDQRDYERRLKVIEDHMWQHKQEERELKRIEGDIIKNQRTVKRTLRDYEHAITRKRLTETKKLSQGMEKHNREQNSHIHKKEETTKQRIEANIQANQLEKDIGRKAQLNSSSLARKYRAKMGELELKHAEMARLSADFEAKIHRKEDEQFRLKQELADLAISLNMESQKGRVQESDFTKDQKKETVKRIKNDQDTDKQLENKLTKSEGDTKNAEIGRRKLSADLTLTRGHLHLKQREEGRHLQDTENRIRANISVQKQLNEAALHADLDSKQRQTEARMHEHDTRRVIQATQKSKQRHEKSESHESHYSQKFQKRFMEQTRREHEDGLKFFQKMMTKGEEREHNLYNKVRNSEYARQKQDQLVKRLHTKLTEARKSNAAKIKSEMSDLDRQERELQYQLQREQAQLAKVHTEREESYNALQHHRELLREDRHQFSAHNREHSRLMRIGTRTDITA